MKRPTMGIVLTLLSSFLLMGAASPELRVQAQAGKLTVQADGVPLHAVLWAISAQTGIKLNLRGGMQTGGGLVVDRFSDLSLEQGITRLLQKHLKQSNYVIVTDQKTGVPTTIYILGGGDPSTPAQTVTKAPTPSPSVAEQSRARIMERGAPSPSMGRKGRSGSIEQAIDAARAASDPEAQIQALLALGNFQDPRTLELLGPALQSDTPEVRRSALEAMRWGTVSDVAVLTDIRSVAASDPDPTVRQAALGVLVRYDESPEARALLEKLAAEESGTARDFILQELKRMDMEAEARTQPDPQVNPQ